MIEYLSAVADDVYWDRHYYRGQCFKPDNWIATQEALLSRGLIRYKPALTVWHKKSDKAKKEHDARKEKGEVFHSYVADWDGYMQLKGGVEASRHELTPAGQAVVEMLKAGGMFVSAKIAKKRMAASGGKP